MKPRRTARGKVPGGRAPIWLFDLDDTLHNASAASMGELHLAMGDYIQRELRVSADDSHALGRRYWLRYGATLLGLMRHHGVDAAHFLHHTHQLPGLEERIQGQVHDLHALSRLPGRKFVLTNAPAAYARRVLGVLGIAKGFDGLISIEDLRMFGQLRPKPDARMLRRVAALLRVPPRRCVLVEDSAANLRGARRAGMRTVWMRRWLPRPAARRLGWRCPPCVDHRVSHLRQLLQLAADWSKPKVATR